MIHDQDSTIRAYLAASAEASPAPAAGSAAALAGALGAAMGQMVTNLSARKRELASLADLHGTACARFAHVREALAGLIVEDQAAFAALTAARRLSAEDPRRDAAFVEALGARIAAPRAIAQHAVLVLATCDLVADISHRPVLADLAACADLAMAAVRTGANLMRVNATEFPADADRIAAESGAADLLASGLALIRQIDSKIWTDKSRP